MLTNSNWCAYFHLEHSLLSFTILIVEGIAYILLEQAVL